MADDYTGDATASDGDKAVKKPSAPEGFESAEAFLRHMRKEFDDDVTHDKDNREAAVQDVQFLVGDQWDDSAKQRRIAAQRPTLTVNRLPAYVAQVVGNRRLNETVIKVLPDNGGTKETAEVREGLIRSIQKLSRAELAYDKGLEGSVICGQGNFQVLLDYTNDDVFEQEIKVAAIPNHMAVIWDRMRTDPTGADASHCFVIDPLSADEFKQRFPEASPVDISDPLSSEMAAGGWFENNTVRVVSYWRMKTRKRTLALLNDGTTVDITDNRDPNVIASITQRADGSPYVRKVDRKYACMYLCSGADILEGPYELPISRLPVFRVTGWEVLVGEKLTWWGLVRFLKDPQRLHNYWRSTIAEKLMGAPRARFIAGKMAVAGREAEWRQSHLSDDPLLMFNDDQTQNPPILVPPQQIEQALIAEAQMSVQDMRDVSNLHEANLGMPSNEVSGRAIVARQRIGDLGTILYHDNLNAAIEQAGVVINELIPVVYDTKRVIKIIGPDGKDKLQAINDIGDKAAIDITAGKYAVTLVSGPSTMTKRIEASENMMGLVNAMPNIVAVAADLIIEAQDWPGAQEIAKRLRKALPPGMLSPDDMTPEEMQAAQAQSQAAEVKAQTTMAATVAEITKTQAQAQADAARAALDQAKAQAIGPELAIKSALATADVKSKAMKSVSDVIKAAAPAPAARPAAGNKRK